MILTKRHVMIAFIIALLLHLSLALAWILNRKTTEETAIQPGLAGVTVSLASAGDLVDASEAAAAATSTEEQPPVEEEPTEPSEPQPETPVEPEPEPEPIPEPEPEPEPVPEPEPIPEPEPEPEPIPEPEPEPVPEPKPVPPPPRPQPAPVPQPAPTPTERVADVASEGSESSDTLDTSASEASTAGAHTQGQDEVIDTGGDPAAEANYFAQLSHYLGQHKRYPMAARRQRREGVAEVEFTLSRTGRVLNARLLRSSGHNLLDREVMEMLERAAPMPAFPSSITAEQLVITLPVSFSLSDR